MILLVTDFGLCGPYTGQMQAVLYREAPEVPVISLFADAPAFNPRASAYLLASYAEAFPAGSVFLCVIDPGVGSERWPLVLQADERWYVGPDNGLLSQAAARAGVARWWRITYQPAQLSASFHGRDLFAPVAARIARGEAVPGEPCAGPLSDTRSWPADLWEVIYIDHYGNAMTGIRADTVSPDQDLVAAGRRMAPARVFADRSRGAGLWYRNANGLVEIAVNQGRADQALGLAVGSPVKPAG